MIKSLPLPEDIKILYPNTKVYKQYSVDNKLLASYVKDDKTGEWKDTLAIELAKQELEAATAKLNQATQKEMTKDANESKTT